jgi:hypothetical protein
MKKTTLALFCLSSLLATASEASYRQDNNICLQIADNSTTAGFKAHLESTDSLDWGTTVGPIHANLTACDGVSYNNGPKTVKLSVESKGGPDIKLIPGAGCDYMSSNGDDTLQGKVDTITAGNLWVFKVAQTERSYDGKPVFELQCEWQTYD